MECAKDFVEGFLDGVCSVAKTAAAVGSMVLTGKKVLKK